MGASLLPPHRLEAGFQRRARKNHLFWAIIPLTIHSLRGSGLVFAFDESWAPHEKHRIETVLASARLVLSATFLAIVFLSSAARAGDLSNSISVALLYVVYSAAILATVTVAPRHTNAFLVAVHVGDMLWPSVISVAAQGTNSPVFVLYIFVLFAAAYRWGFQLT